MAIYKSIKGGGEVTIFSLPLWEKDYCGGACVGNKNEVERRWW